MLFHLFANVCKVQVYRVRHGIAGKELDCFGGKISVPHMFDFMSFLIYSPS